LGKPKITGDGVQTYYKAGLAGVFIAVMGISVALPTLGRGQVPSSQKPPLAAGQAFIPGSEDVPLMPGLSLQEDSLTPFSTGDGKFLTLRLIGQVLPQAVQAFYEESLPPLGWQKLTLPQLQAPQRQSATTTAPKANAQKAPKDLAPEKPAQEKLAQLAFGREHQTLSFAVQALAGNSVRVDVLLLETVP
jgi:hypothetical protein